MADFDFSELNVLAADLGEVAAKSGKPFRQAVEVSARKVKDAARGKVGGRKHFKQAASAIDYEMKGFQGFGATVIQAEVGYNKDRPTGRLGNLVEFGAPNAPAMMNVKRGGKWVTVPVPGGGKRPLPPGGELQDALHETEDDFQKGIEMALDAAMKEAGL